MAAALLAPAQLQQGARARRSRPPPRLLSGVLPKGRRSRAPNAGLKPKDGVFLPHVHKLASKSPITTSGGWWRAEDRGGEMKRTNYRCGMVQRGDPSTPSPLGFPVLELTPQRDRRPCVREEDTSRGRPGRRSDAPGGLGGRDRAVAAAAERAGPVEAARARASQRNDARQAAASSDSTAAASGSGTAGRPPARPRPAFPAPQRAARGKAKFGSRR